VTRNCGHFSCSSLVTSSDRASLEEHDGDLAGTIFMNVMDRAAMQALGVIAAQGGFAIGGLALFVFTQNARWNLADD
jgi:hypothetical protein